MRPSLLLAASVLAIGAALSAPTTTLAEAPAASARTAPRAGAPNIIVIVADDLGYGDTGAYGSKTIRTPNIDRLADEGVRFTDAYVTHPVCAPSRASLLTGRYQQRFGYEFNPVGRDRTGGVSRDEVMIGQVMKTAGYDTGMVGKWHLGEPQGYHPLDRGFDAFFGMTGGASAYILNPTPEDRFFTVPGSEASERTTNEPDPRLARLSLSERLQLSRRNAPIFRGREAVEEREYLTEAFTRESLAFIERPRDQPFFLYLAYNAPHTPLQVTGKYYDRFPEIADPAQRTYAAMVSALDDGIGEILRKLEATGQDKNTLIVFLSDNGCAGYLRGACSNAPLSGAKALHLEGGIRVPFLMRWPGRIKPAQVDSRPISSLDILPTAAALGGARLSGRALDGVDLTPYVTGKDKGVPNPTLFWRAGVNFVVRDGRWKLLVVNKAAPNQADPDARASSIVPDGIEATVGPQGQHVMLYDLVKDPGEQQNLAAENPRIVARLRAKLASWNRGLVKPEWTSRRWATFNWDDETLQQFN